MRIYVDFDDCLCETARAFSKLALEMFNKLVPYDQIHHFELDRSVDTGGHRVYGDKAAICRHRLFRLPDHKGLSDHQNETTT